MPRRSRVLAIAFLFVIAIVAMVAYVLSGKPFDAFDERNFDPKVWKQADPDVRATMGGDLVKHYLPIGMAESRVVALLGKPEEIDDGDSNARLHVGTRHLIYDFGNPTGRCKLADMDAAWLYVDLDSKRNIVAVEIYGYLFSGVIERNNIRLRARQRCLEFPIYGRKNNRHYAFGLRHGRRRGGEYSYAAARTVAKKNRD